MLYKTGMRVIAKDNKKYDESTLHMKILNIRAKRNDPIHTSNMLKFKQGTV